MWLFININLEKNSKVMIIKGFLKKAIPELGLKIGEFVEIYCDGDVYRLKGHVENLHIYRKYNSIKDLEHVIIFDSALARRLYEW